MAPLLNFPFNALVILKYVYLFLCVNVQNKIEPKMDEAPNNGAAELRDSEEAPVEERRFVPEEVFN